MVRCDLCIVQFFFKVLDLAINIEVTGGAVTFERVWLAASAHGCSTNENVWVIYMKVNVNLYYIYIQRSRLEK